MQFCTATLYTLEDVTLSKFRDAKSITNVLQYCLTGQNIC